MPDRPSWSERTLEILESRAQMEEEFQSRRQVEELLDLKARAAQNLMKQAGATEDGKAFVIEKDLLRVFLETRGGAELERERRKKLAQRLSEIREERIKQPPCLVEMPLKTARHFDRCGLDSLPEGIELGPGYVRVQFTDMQDCLWKLMALALAAGKDMDELNRRITTGQMKLGATQ